jgi:protein-S-isoprenylcysteine O-methyltransferase Ste14
MNRKLIVRYSIRETLGLVLMGTVLFWAAGKFNWWPAWAALGVMGAWIIATAYVILRFNPDLLAERLGPRKGAKTWDTVIMSLLGLTQLSRYIVAGLDQRYSWTGGFPFAAQLYALVFCILGYALVLWATTSNAFFSQIVRIQPERNQVVVKGGPYRFVRHPAYLGAILYEFAVSVLLASWWVLLIGLLATILLLVRTLLEDKTLQNELGGYPEYAQQVRYRLIPGIW